MKLHSYIILGDFMEVLKFNSKGVLVEYVQSLLNTLGFSNLNIDGIFGSKTKEAVINF